MGWVTAIQAGVENFTGGLQQFVDNRAKAKEAKLQADAAMDQAEANAAVYRRQAEAARIQAGQAQRQGEYEANKRSRLLAEDIGSAYANWAGNGLMVDGKGKDTLGDIVMSDRGEAAYDIDVINENAYLNAWTYQKQAQAHSASAAAAIKSGKLQRDAYMRQYKAAKVASKHGVMQSVSGLPSAFWQAAGVNSYHKFGGIMGNVFSINPGMNAAGGYAIAKG